jgi:hypothetical protein
MATFLIAFGVGLGLDLWATWMRRNRPEWIVKWGGTWVREPWFTKEWLKEHRPPPPGSE